MDASSLCQDCGLAFAEKWKSTSEVKKYIGDEWGALTLTPEPLHTNLLGPANDALQKLEEYYDDEMKLFY